MRPGQNKRMRGRNNNSNRKGPNPLTRTFESNGPDVKIRGTAHHVTEKYLQLARDAQSSGDPVMAESYLQHAEHYYRIIAAAQQAQQQAQVGYVRPAGEADAEEDDDDDGGMPDRFASPFERQPPSPPAPFQGQPQPFGTGGQQPYVQGNFNAPQAQQPQGERQHGERQERGPRPDRPFQDRNQQGRNNNPNRGPRPDRANFQQPRFDNRVESEEQPDTGLPAFITAPVRIPASDEVVIGAGDQPEIGTDVGENEGVGFHLRPRRRRRRPAGEEGENFPRGDVPTAE